MFRGEYISNVQKRLRKRTITMNFTVSDNCSHGRSLKLFVLYVPNDKKVDILKNMSPKSLIDKLNYDIVDDVSTKIMYLESSQYYIKEYTISENGNYDSPGNIVLVAKYDNKILENATMTSNNSPVLFIPLNDIEKDNIYINFYPNGMLRRDKNKINKVINNGKGMESVNISTYSPIQTSEKIDASVVDKHKNQNIEITDTNINTPPKKNISLGDNNIPKKITTNISLTTRMNIICDSNGRELQKKKFQWISRVEELLNQYKNSYSHTIAYTCNSGEENNHSQVNNDNLKNKSNEMMDNGAAENKRNSVNNGNSMDNNHGVNNRNPMNYGNSINPMNNSNSMNNESQMNKNGYKNAKSRKRNGNRGKTMNKNNKSKRSQHSMGNKKKNNRFNDQNAGNMVKKFNGSLWGRLLKDVRSIDDNSTGPHLDGES